MINLSDFKDNPFMIESAEEVFSVEAIVFVSDLVRTFLWRIEDILEQRRIQQKLFDCGKLPHFLDATKSIRESEWKVATIPNDLQDRRVEITGPVERKMIINALNSGANVFMADFEDSLSPTWDNVVQGQVNLMGAVRHTISFTNEAGKEYKLNDKTAVLMVRPRGWHLVEKHFKVDGKVIPASLFDFGFYFFHNAKELIARGTAPYFYLPKMESHEEAQLWNDVFIYAQQQLNIPVGTIRATCLIETITAAFEMDEILWELKDHVCALNTGRYDYIFSFIKKFAENPDFILPDRVAITMDTAFLQAYCKLLVNTCHKRGAHAMGGMAAQIPVKNDPVANEAAFEKVRVDKLREVMGGFSGAWVSHPALVKVVKDVFDQFMPAPNQIGQRDLHPIIREANLLQPHQGARTMNGLRNNIRVAIQYLEAWLRGVGAVAIYNLMEDAATYQINYALVWQWLHHNVMVDDVVLTEELLLQTIDEEMVVIKNEVSKKFDSGKFQQAKELFTKAVLATEFEEFFMLSAYDLLD